MRKRFWIIGFCLFVLLATTAFSIMAGSFTINPPDVLRALLGGRSGTYAPAVFQIRSPRTVLAILVRNVLGISGAILQGITKNLPVKPGMIDINMGSALFMVLWTLYGANAYCSSLPNVRAPPMSLLAIAEAFCTTAFLYAYSWRKGIRPTRFLLTDVGINTGITVVISFHQLQVDKRDYNQVLVWIDGSLWGSSWCYIPISIPLVLLLAGLV